ncbi:hypothetical protein [Streptomyces sp. NPDC048436]|uniref:hypothetical protein n=1 Tax=Streptomyces sp. NPDC048436 TaxID=3365550 RepID=UPI00370FAF3B
MEITGYSSDYIADLTFPVSMRRFVGRRHQRWPGLFLYGEPVSTQSLDDWKLPDDDDGDDDYSGIVTFSAGQEMEDFWEENGYALDGVGEGPFSVFYRLHSQPLRADRVTGVRSVDAEAATALEGTGLLLAEYYAVSLVTPDDPAADPFSGRVLADFLESFGAAAR